MEEDNTESTSFFIESVKLISVMKMRVCVNWWQCKTNDTVLWSIGKPRDTTTS